MVYAFFCVIELYLVFLTVLTPACCWHQVIVTLRRGLCPCRRCQITTFHKSQPSSLLFIPCMNCIDGNSRVNGSVTGGSCRINRLLYAYDLVLHVGEIRDLWPRRTFGPWCLYHKWHMVTLRKLCVKMLSSRQLVMCNAEDLGPVIKQL